MEQLNDEHPSFHADMQSELQHQPAKLFQEVVLSMGYDEHLVTKYYAANFKEIEADGDLQHLNVFVERFINWVALPQQTCTICLEPMDRKVALSCQHSFCVRCMTSYLTNLINTRKVEKIPCMVEGCEHMINRDEVRSVVRPDQFVTYQRYVRNSELSRNPNLRWCTSPSCQGYALRLHDEKKLTCSCGQQICFDCGQSWHERSCEAEFRLQYGKIIDSMHLQKCPKCGLHVQKISGCNHMRCTKCNYQYCWLCLGRYTDHHYRWWNVFGCPKQQNSQRYWRGWKYLFVVGFLPMLALALIAFSIVSVIIAVVGGLVGPLLFVRRFVNHSLRFQRRWVRVLMWILCIALTLILYPVSCLLFWVPGSCIVTYNFLRRAM